MSVVDSPQPASAYTYADTNLPDALCTSIRRYASFPIVSLDAERLHSTVAPAIARPAPGVSATHRSSQISHPMTKSAIFSHEKRSLLPNGTLWRHRVIVSFSAGAGVKWRSS